MHTKVYFTGLQGCLVCCSHNNVCDFYTGKDLGFKSSLFNLVFANNAPSVRLWRKLGFTELACIPKAADLKGCAELVDAYQFYFDFSTFES
jgi:hypothetical protein